MSGHLTIATTNGDLGGGEVMLLHLAEATRSLGHGVTVVGPRHPSGLVEAASATGLAVVTLDVRDRRSYAVALRAWDRRERQGLLWCNGLLPAAATAGHRDRVVHLHREPEGPQKGARLLAVRGARAVVVPSESMGARVGHTAVLPNWTEPLVLRPAAPLPESPTIGFLGRTTVDKGVHLLARAVRRLRDEGLSARLLVAGEARFGTAEDVQVVEAALAPLGDAVDRVGWIDRDDFFDRVDLAVFPSTWAEPFGLVAAEAMGSGVPFVISDAGALPEVAGAEHPWVARADDAVDLARVVGDALRASAEQREAARQASRLRWEQRFSPEAGAERLAVLLSQL
ncbi:hypothetical protein GCM10011519_27130 [Marmoricola endophyticus]|uniref:Glycosyltransferase n=1 Tax=Marmoricola endophyticus TaxID=2040280 RepID=A0A917BPH2_9ACTN|nr:glycosyltransferase family 4 protein [Marmoricola endophyticus]GGF51681.1 hypothetical protein GCM10011519_27130 [Marmoricola endophyticus]